MLLAGILPAGCTIAPDVFSSPKPGAPPQVQRDAGRSPDLPVTSVIMEQARAHPEAHRVILLEDGDDALLARIHLIRAARESIDVQTFIWVYDDSGLFVFRELLAAARRGVKVRILVDQNVPPKISTEEYAALVTAHENLELRLFRPISRNAINTSWTFTHTALTRYSTLNRRMHNKILAVDGVAAITGGRNYQDAYFDRDPEFDYLDRDVLISGPAMAGVRESFETFWNSRKAYEASRMSDLKEALEEGRARMPEAVRRPVGPKFAEIDRLAGRPDLAAIRPSLKSWPVADLEFMWDSPAKFHPFGIGSDRDAFEPIIAAVRAAEEEVCFESPYVVMGKKGYKLFRSLRKENPGLQLRVVTNSLSSTDNVYAGAISLKQRRSLIVELGCELYVAKPQPGEIRQMVSRYGELLQENGRSSQAELPTGAARIEQEQDGPVYCIHSKSIVVDREICYVGSHNFDPRSFSLNTECGVIIRDAAFSIHLEGIIRKKMRPQNSWVVAARDYPPVMEELNSFITAVSSQLPLFDIWPLEHSSCYELKEGFEPVPPDHPEFYERYEDVGPIPGLDIGMTTVQAELIRGFAGIATPLM